MTQTLENQAVSVQLALRSRKPNQLAAEMERLEREAREELCRRYGVE